MQRQLYAALGLAILCLGLTLISSVYMFGFIATVFLVGIVCVVDKRNQDEMERLEAQIKRLSDRVDGVQVTQRLGR